MLILTIRTDKPEAEIGLYESEQQLKYHTWEAHRMLAETLHTKIQELLQSQNKTLLDLQGIVVYKGPGSFTGLRIGVAVANSLAYSQQIPITGESGAWIEQGITRLNKDSVDSIVLPEYGTPAHITQQKK